MNTEMPTLRRFMRYLGVGRFPKLVVACYLIFLGTMVATEGLWTHAFGTFSILVGVASVVEIVVRGRLAVVRQQRARRWAAQGRCSNCGYLLHGLASERCPECGEVIELEDD